MLTAALFLQFSALHYCWQGCRHTKTKRDLHRRAAVGCSVSKYSQMLADLCHSLHFFFNFTDPVRRELKETKKERKEKKQ
jgi:hypothetical protein